MLKKILNLVPINILQQIGSSIVEILHEKDELRNWQPDQSDVSETYCYLDLEIKIVACAKLNYWYWYWFVCDGRGTEILGNGTATTENDAIALAVKWANAFLADDLDTLALAEEEIDV